jgi:UDP-N-acetylglucosamine diphosphorylase / glucose-1-phosphate thymidylyltransferase / UDP-N-acetylgalactosamine diphosphorylase / glucosamine-1-phosphate N-acetyltransferase / galactosamine-1-phosphate N-acetyltransferase
MAGAGSRFANAGYTLPKPLIDVMGMPMFVLSTRNVIELCGSDPSTIVFVVDEAMNRQFGLTGIIRNYYPQAKVVSLSERTQGAASTVLAALSYLDPGMGVVVANCDQVVDHSNTSAQFADLMKHSHAGIVVFHHPERETKWSYAKINDYGRVQMVAEKNPISDWATVGIYYWARASVMADSIMDMMKDNHRFNGEFYLCPAFNYQTGLYCAVICD